jgi:hypothetical protein
MPIFLQDLWDRRNGVSSNLPYVHEGETLPANFPVNRWTIQLQRYMRYWDHFTGQIWEETVPDEEDDDGNPVLRYPLQINYIKTVSIKQNAVLWGETSDTLPALAPIRVQPKRARRDDDVDEEAKRRAEELENLINDVWEENQGAALQQEGGLISQFLGGVVYQISWKGMSFELQNGINIEIVLPDFFMPVWNTGKPDDLLEVWIAWRVPAREAALRFNYKPTGDGGNDPMYVQHWTKDEYSLYIADQPLELDGIRFEHLPNPFSIVPFVYIPRRRVANYFGLSIVDDLEGLARELNSRVADMGDIIRETAQRDTFIRNVTNNIKTRDIGGLRPAVDLGNNGPGQEQPDVFNIDPPTLSEGLTKFPNTLSEQFSNDSGVPPIAYGIDEGSQRSALTLATRFWPLTSEARSQRNHWGVGLKRIAQIIGVIAMTKNLRGITLDHLMGIRMKVSWAAMIPRDTELTLNMVVSLMGQWALDPETALEKLDIVDDPLEVIEKAKVFFQWKAEQEAKAQAMGKPQDASGSKNNPEIKKPTSAPSK